MENNKNNENREFYVYAHIRLDKMETFYVGKGKGERAYDLERNYHHDNISNRYGHAVVIIANNLTEEEAFELERDMIEDYVFNLGYGIDIEGHKDYNHELPHLTNMTWGGEGSSGLHHSEETKQVISEKCKGEKNGMWGKNPYANKTEEEMEIIRRKMSENAKGRNPYANKTPEEIEIIRRKISEKNKGKNPYANKTEEEMEIIRRKIGEKSKGRNAFANKTEEEKEIIGRKISEKVSGEKNGMWGKPSPNRSKVICITTGEIFNSIKEAENYYDVGGISKCCKGKLKSAGKLNGTKLQWIYLENYNNEFKGILINPIAE